MQKIIAIGDIHGCLEEFQELLKLVDYKSSNVRVLLVGDLIDRGEDSVGCIRLARELGLESVLGNHEKKFLKWNNNKNSRSDVYDCHAHYKKLSNEDVNYIARMPTFIKIKEANFAIIHAGLRANTLLEKQTDQDLCYLRYMDDNSKFVSLHKVNKLGLEESKAHFWTEFGPFDFNYVYGHNVSSLTDIRIDKYNDGSAVYGIDTGCCFGGKLSAIDLETKEIIQVQAKKVYYQPKFGA